MRKMTQTVDGGVRQKTPEIHEETFIERNIAPVPFSMNQSSALCLPLVSDSKQLIWVHSNQINLEVDGAAELDKAFSRFPYLTQNQTAALAQRCSLHPDQVKVWFMVQRLRYGISWDYKDILKVQRKFSSSQDWEQLQNDRGEKNKWNKEVKKTVTKEQSTKERKMIGEHLRGSEQEWMKQEQPLKKQKYGKVKLEKHESNNWKRMKVTEKMEKKRGIDEAGEDREVEITRDEMASIKFKPTPSEKTFFAGKKKKTNTYKRLISIQELPAQKSFVVSDEALDMCAPLIPMSQSQAFDVLPLTAHPKPKIEQYSSWWKKCCLCPF